MKNMSPWWIRIPVIFFLIFGMMEFFIDSGDKPAIIEYPITQFFMLMVLLILIGIEVILKSIESVLYQTLSEEAKAKYNESKANKWETTSTGKLFKKLTGNKPIETEGEIILDHDYDGIRELDNTLPPWWVYMFYGTIIFAIIYLLRFEVFDGYNQDLEYDQEVAAAQIAIEEYKKTAKGLVDAESVELLTGASDIKAGEALFTANCVACHMADGGGGIGPNLTDKNWILGGGIKNIFNTISEGGRDGKGMVAWKQNLKPAEIAQVASYVIQEIGGKTPANPKDAEGDIWVDPNAPTEEIPEQATDSITVVVNE